MADTATEVKNTYANVENLEANKPTNQPKG
jgi:hypothetical protein